MAKKIFTYRGKKVEDLQAMSIDEFAQLVPSRLRRSLKRGFTEDEKKVIAKLEKGKDNIKTHCRDLIILPIMIGKILKVHQGKEFVAVRVTEEMIGHVLGEFAITRKRVGHSSPGVGATRSSSAISVR